MATRSVKKKSKKKSAPEKKPTSKKSAPTGDPTVVDPATLEIRPRARRASRFDDVAKKLLDNPGKAVIVQVPENSKPEVYRTMLYARLPKCLDFVKPGQKQRPSISILQTGHLGVTLVD